MPFCTPWSDQFRTMRFRASTNKADWTDLPQNISFSFQFDQSGMKKRLTEKACKYFPLFRYIWLLWISWIRIESVAIAYLIVETRKSATIRASVVPGTKQWDRQTCMYLENTLLQCTFSKEILKWRGKGILHKRFAPVTFVICMWDAILTTIKQPMDYEIDRWLERNSKSRVVLDIRVCFST